VTSCQKLLTNDCTANCPWTVHCLANTNGNPISVRFCSNCEEAWRVDSTGQEKDPDALLDILRKIYPIVGIEKNSDVLYLASREAKQIWRLAKVARDICPKAESVTLDFSCQACLSTALYNLPANQIKRMGAQYAQLLFERKPE